eukprot:scaffold11069_cov93-Skeletonema_marinoi.AAC.1
MMAQNKSNHRKVCLSSSSSAILDDASLGQITNLVEMRMFLVCTPPIMMGVSTLMRMIIALACSSACSSTMLKLLLKRVYWKNPPFIAVL